MGPFGLRNRHTEVVVDQELVEEGHTVLCGAGAPDAHIAVHPADLVKWVHAKVAVVHHVVD